MRFTLVDLLVVIVVVSVSLALNSVEREGRLRVVQGKQVLFEILYPYYGYPFEAYVPNENGGIFTAGTIWNWLITVAGVGLTVFLVRKVRQRPWRNTPPADPPAA